MTTLDIIRMVLANLLRMKARVVMTSAGVIIGTVAMVLLISIGLGLQQQALQNIGSIGELTELTITPANQDGTRATNASANALLTPKSIEKMRQLAGVRAVSPVITLDNGPAIFYKKWQGYAVVYGIDSTQLKAMGWKLHTGKLDTSARPAIVGGRLAEYMRDPKTPQNDTAPFTDTAVLLGQFLQLNLIKPLENNYVERRLQFKVTGVLAVTGTDKDTAIYLPMSDVMSWNAWQSGRRLNVAKTGYASAMLFADTPQTAARLEAELTQQGYVVNSSLSIIRGINDTFQAMQWAMGGVGAISLLVAGFGIANTMMMAIYERRREIGVMKAVGATDRDILFVFLGEAGSIGLMGGVLGCAMALLLVKGLQPVLVSLSAVGGGMDVPAGLTVVTPAWLVAMAIVIAVSVGLLAGLYPALKTTRLDPIAVIKSD